MKKLKPQKQIINKNIFIKPVIIFFIFLIFVIQLSSFEVNAESKIMVQLKQEGSFINEKNLTKVAEMLKGKSIGTYFFRPSSQSGFITVSYMKGNGQVANMRFQENDDKLALTVNGDKPTVKLFTTKEVIKLLALTNLYKESTTIKDPLECEKKSMDTTKPIDQTNIDRLKDLKSAMIKNLQAISPTSDFVENTLKFDQQITLNRCTLFYLTFDPLKLKAEFEKLKTSILDKLKRLGLSTNDVNIEFIPREGYVNINMDKFTAEAIFPEYHKDFKYAGCWYNVHDVVKNFTAMASKEIKGFVPVKKQPLDLSALNLKTASAKDLIKTMLQQGSYVVIGETHSDRSAKKALIESMDNIIAENAVIALEHLPYVPYQKLLDDYLSGAPDMLMPKLLEIYLKNLDEGHSAPFGSTRLTKSKYNFTNIIKAAKEANNRNKINKNKIRILTVDTTTTYHAGESGFGSRGAKRYLAMNVFAKKIVEKMAEGRKVVFFVGSAHTNTRLAIPGVSELMGASAHSIVIRDADKKLIPEIRENVFEESDEVGIRADISVVEEVIE
ncbi:MAG: hypothetical protein HQK51_04985 [Oligoflexia bacterium]|nr:hypothetical protein [Oligoflexia bacterium]